MSVSAYRVVQLQLPVVVMKIIKKGAIVLRPLHIKHA